jgi:phage terminase small subunit
VTDRENRFCDEYLLDLNATQAAIRAGYTPSTAEGASKWIYRENPEKPRLRARIDQALAERSARTGINADRVLRELARLGFVDITDVVDMNLATVRPGANRDDTAAIASVKVKSGEDFTEREIKLHDKPKALEMIGKHLGMFVDRVAITDDRPTIVDNIPGANGNG